MLPSLKRTKPVLAWPGGKSRMLKSILPLPGHTCYCEAFAGGLAVLLAKSPSQIEVINDINGDLISLYRFAQWHLDALISEIEFTLTSRRNLTDFTLQPGLTELQRAARFLLRNRTSFGGGMKSYAVVRGGGGTNKIRSNVVGLLRALNSRLDRVSIENLSYQRMLSLYDAPETLFFLDPPYYNSKPGSAYEGWSEEQMREFSNLVLTLKGNWIVTVDDSPLSRSLFAGCQMEMILSRNGSVNKRLQPTATFKELIIRPERR